MMVRGLIVATWILASVVAPGRGGIARADDRVATLDRTLATSSSDKVRLSAALALATIGDPRARTPLVSALHDPSPDVRAVAVVALGRLGHRPALAAVRELAIRDADHTVRARARTASRLIARANRLPDAAADASADDRVAAPHPDLYLVVQTASDDAPTGGDAATRRADADLLRRALVDQCDAQPSVTRAADEAARWGLEPRQLDVSVVKLEVATVGANVEVEARLRLAISDGTGKLQSFVSGGAVVSVAKAKLDAAQLRALRDQAIEGAMRGIFDALLGHLRKTSV